MSGRDYSGARWIKTYAEQTAADLLLSPEARAVLDEFRRKADAAGIIETTEGIPGLAVVLRHFPFAWVESALAELVKSRHLEILPDGRGYIDPEHFDAQAKRGKADAQLQQESRARRRADLMLGKLGRRPNSDGNADSDNGNPDGAVRNPDRMSTREEKREEKKRSDERKRSSAASPRSPKAATGSSSPTKKPSQIEIPQEWAPTPAHRERAAGLGVDVDASAERFRNHHAGSLFNGWAAINGRFANWIEGDKARGPRGANGKASNVGPVRATAGTDEEPITETLTTW